MPKRKSSRKEPPPPQAKRARSDNTEWCTAVRARTYGGWVASCFEFKGDDDSGVLVLEQLSDTAQKAVGVLDVVDSVPTTGATAHTGTKLLTYFRQHAPAVHYLASPLLPSFLVHPGTGMHNVLLRACGAGHLACAQWWFERFPLTASHAKLQHALLRATKHGHAETVRWLMGVAQRHGRTVTLPRVFRMACRHQHLKLAQWLLEQSQEPNLPLSCSAISVCGEHTSKFRVLDWLITFHPEAARKGVLRELAVRCCQGSNLKLIKYLQDKYGLELQPGVYLNQALFCNQWKVVEWIAGLPRIDPLVLSRAFNYVCSSDCLDAVRCLVTKHQQKPYITQPDQDMALHRATMPHTDPKILRWLLTSPQAKCLTALPWLAKMSRVLHKVCREGSFEMLRAVGAKIPSGFRRKHVYKVMELGARFGHLKLVQWARDWCKSIGSHMVLNKCFRDACLHGHTGVATWLVDNFPKHIDGNNDTLFAQICQTPFVDMARWYRTQFPYVQSPKACHPLVSALFAPSSSSSFFYSSAGCPKK